MYTLAEMTSRLNYLKTLCPAEGQKLIEELRAAIVAYLARDSDFELQVNKTLDKVIANAFHHNLEYENADLFNQWIEPIGNAPEGYNDVSKLFRAKSIFDEILTVRDMDFRLAFYSETKDSADGYSTSDCHNRYVDKWIEQLTAAITFEMESLKSIMQYCANRSYSVEWAILFEELGKNVKRHPVKYYAKQIYLTQGWGWLIETFNLNVYRPSYMAELPNWEEEE